MPATVLIAPSEHLSILQGAPDFGETQAFADADALKALEVIMRQRPRTVVLERGFAGTSRGAALINRIKADPVLATCEIRIVSPPEPGSTGATPEAPAVSVVPVEAPVAQPPLDQRGTRRTARARIAEGVEVSIDGNAATLVDLSPAGAQVLSFTVLKPNQRVRVLLPSAAPPLRLTGVIAWAAFEIPKSGPRYRAGVEFVANDAEPVQRFIERHRR